MTTPEQRYLEVITTMVEHFLIMRGANPAALMNTTVVAECLIGVDDPFDQEEIADILDRALTANGLTDAADLLDAADFFAYALQRLGPPR